MKIKYTEPINDFADGLRVLKSYHEDFLRRGRELLVLVDAIKQQGLNEARAHQCVRLFCHYEHANHLHHQDEEQALFPLLVGKSVLIDGMIERLLLDHEAIEKSWSALAEQLRQPERVTDFDRFVLLARAFEKIQRQHLNREDEDFSPRIKAMLDVEQIRQMGEKMASMRHLPV